MIPCAKLKTQPGDDQPAAPEQHLRAARRRCAGARRAIHSRHDEAAAARPGAATTIWPPISVVEQPGRARSRPTAPRLPLLAAAADAAGLVAGEPAEAVVAERSARGAVVLRAADVRPATTPATARRSPPTSRPTTTSRRRRRAAGTIRRRSGGRARRQVDERERRARRGTPAASWPGSAKPTSDADEHAASACEPRSSARVSAYAAPTSSSTSSASGLLNRNISAATGVSASDRAGEQRRPARRTSAGRSRRAAPTVATPSSACGTRMLHEFDAEEPGRQVHHPQRRRRLVDGDGVRRRRTSRRRRPSSSARRPARRRSRRRSPSPRRRGPRGRGRRSPTSSASSAGRSQAGRAGACRRPRAAGGRTVRRRRLERAGGVAPA